MPMTKAIKRNVFILNQVFCICYLILFKKSKIQVQALIDPSSKINAITTGYVLKLGLKVCPINIKAQKINGFALKIFKIVLASF